MFWHQQAVSGCTEGIVAQVGQLTGLSGESGDASLTVS